MPLHGVKRVLPAVAEVPELRHRSDVVTIGREIIRRWLHATPPELWSHQGRHHYHHQLGKFAKYVPGGPSGSPEWYRGTWVPKAADEDGSGVDR